MRSSLVVAMSNYNISSTGHDAHGRYYDLDDDAPFEGITVDEAMGTITIHEMPERMKLSDEYYQYLGYMQRWGKLGQTKEYIEWLEDELLMDWETHGYPYNSTPSSEE